MMSNFEDREEQLTLLVIAERINSLREVSMLNFQSIREQLDIYRNLPVKVERLEGEMNAVKEDVAELKETSVRGVEFRRGSLPIILLTLALVLTGVGTILTQIH